MKNNSWYLILFSCLMFAGCSYDARSGDRVSDMAPINSQQPELLSCKRYFDGCNICTESQGVISCSDKVCEKTQEARCLDGK